MNTKVLIFIGVAGLSTVINAQSSRQATITGGGSPNGGKCTVEVVVDGTAEVDIHGTTATLRTLQGQPAQWRRFECNAPMPTNVQNFRFEGIDGRGRQSLVRDPRNGGSAVVQIEDRDGGSEGYTFDVLWGGQGGFGTGPGPGPVGNDRNRPGYQDNDRFDNDRGRGGNSRRFTVEQAVRVCQDEVQRQANRRFRNREIRFVNTRIDDNPGRQDWVIGTFEVSSGRRADRYGFSCSVNFGTGVVRSSQIDARPHG